MRETLQEALGKRVLLLDGAMGTMIQTYGLTEADFRSAQMADIPGLMRGNNDLLSVTRPDVILDIHRRYLEAGADIITTNTFNAQRISQADYHTEHLVEQMNLCAVQLARQVAEEFSTPQQPRFVIATVGPTNKTCSMSPDVSNPAYRAVTFDQMADAYREQIVSLLRAGVDAILLETIFDTLNAKAAIYAFRQATSDTGIEVPLMLSVTVNDRYGRLLCGQTLEAFLISVAHARPLSIGLNCSFGAAEMLPCLRSLAATAECYVTAHPNAGLPNEFGSYDQTPKIMAEAMKPFVEERLVNILGGCCGTTPEHIHALRQLVDNALPHVPTAAADHATLHLAGLEPLRLTPEVGFINVGERCNVAGSRKFLRLIKEGSYEDALSIARRQVEDGALVLDMNMDDGLLDAASEMSKFLNLIGSEPDICKVPMMIDSSRWDVIEAGLKCVQGKCIVNSISLKEGHDVFVSHAREVMNLGAAVVVMAFDEQGQATTLERRIEICRRAYHILVDEVGMTPSDIIFDPNVLAIATGISEHDGYALDFIRATAWIRQNLPGTHISGGVSNLSFAFRGNNYLREAMHAVFLYHARQAGMDMAIVNPSSSVTYNDIPKAHLQVIEDAMLRPSPEATERLADLAQQLVGVERKAEESESRQRGHNLSVEERLQQAVMRGNPETLEADLTEALRSYGEPIDIIQGPLMKAMNTVGKLFGEGKMFLPQVIKTARTMKQAVEILSPYISNAQNKSGESSGRVMLATVKGDVHDIGKNIVGMVMACNGFQVVDLGVMVPAEEIVEKARQLRPDIIGLSGLITPSLEEMVRVVRLLRESGIQVPVMIGGATTSEVHTALRIAPVYDGPVVWVRDASQNPSLAARLLNPEQRVSATEEIRDRQSNLRRQHDEKEALRPLSEARDNKLNLF